MRSAIQHSGAGRVCVNLGWERESLEVAVEDRGVGIDRDELRRVFLPKTGGGIGLHVADELVRAMGGSIEAKAIKPGTKVAFSVPAPAHRMMPDA